MLFKTVPRKSTFKKKKNNRNEGLFVRTGLCYKAPKAPKGPLNPPWGTFGGKRLYKCVALIMTDGTQKLFDVEARDSKTFLLKMNEGDFWGVHHISKLRFQTALCVIEFAPQSNV